MGAFLKDGRIKYLRSIFSLIKGVVLAQFILIVTMPLLTRLYTPAEFDYFATYISLVTIFSVAAGLRFDIAISIPSLKTMALNLLWLSVFFTFISSLLLFATFFISSPWLSYVATGKFHEDFIWSVPLGVFLLSAYSALQFWYGRDGFFKILSESRVVQSVFLVLVQIFLAIFYEGGLGLLLGHVFGSGMAVIWLLYKGEFVTGIKRRFCFKHLRLAFLRYKKYPMYSTFESLLNTAGIYAPVLVISFFLEGPEAGYLMLAMRVLQGPMSLVGSSVSQVFLAQMAKTFELRQRSDITLYTLRKLIVVGMAPLIFIGYYSPALFSYVFGGGWIRSGELVQWMVPWFIMQFLSSPISMVMHVAGKQKQMFFLTSLGFALRVGTTIGAVVFSVSSPGEIYAIASFVFYCICFVVFSREAELSKSGYIAIGRLSVLCVAGVVTIITGIELWVG
ncbi:lipopolysaccharide biosynthesis protein [Stutzerimonas nitrititolerans]|uniref:lipopolysaccharide biosynthesis protein n=1 Tax=Stutzerimonas nitrititolerans TaxID=2482751 RepID=UPI00289804C3|nr:oligosaccharide flippase family protein [Stutzerimonas nitrititolerans]